MHLSVLGALAVVGAGILAGAINAIVGSGSLITFPTLVALGYPALVANVSNNIGIVPGNFSGVYSYRHEMTGQASRVRSLVPFSAAGGLTGALALLARPSAFHAVVPFLVLLAVVMVIVQPRVARMLQSRGPRPEAGGIGLRAGVFLVGIYGGYFGAAQGVLLIALLGMCLEGELRRINALRNLCATAVNLVAGILFAVLAPVNWAIVGLLAVSSTLGAPIGAMVGRRLPAPVLRAVIAVFGIAAAIRLFV